MATCRWCYAPIVGRKKNAKVCGLECARQAKLAYMSEYGKALRATPEGREYHREFMRRKRENNPDYRERERAYQRLHYRQQRAAPP